MTALGMFPERDFMGGHTRDDTTFLGASGIRLEWGNLTLELGVVQAALFRPPG